MIRNTRTINEQESGDQPQQRATEEVALEVMAPSALGALEKASVDVQVSTAHAFPRSIEQFRRRAMSLATIDEETAEGCMYRRPVGKKFVDGKWKQEYAEGASVRMAEIVAASYGNIRAQSYLVEQTDRFVRAEAMAWDLEANYACKVQGVESTVTKEGAPFSERMRIVVAKALMAKVYRDAIFKVVPKATIKTVYERCREVAIGKGKSIEQRRAKVADWLKNLSVSDPRVFAALGVKGWSDIGEEQLEILTGLKTAIADKDVTIDEAFPHLQGGHAAKTVPLPPGPPPLEKAKETKPAEKPAKKEAPKNEAPETPITAQEAEEAPEPESEPAESEPEQAPEAPANAPESPESDSEAQTDPSQPLDTPDKRILQLAAKDGVSLKQLMVYLRKVKLARADQKLADLSSTKLNNLEKGWETVLPEIQAVKS